MEKQPDKTIRVIVLDEEKIFNLNDQCLYDKGKVCGKPLVGIPYEILMCLAKHSGRYLTETQIRGNCDSWEEGFGQITQHIYKLRTAIGDHKENESSKEYTYIKSLDRGKDNLRYSCTGRIVNMPISNLPGISTPSVEACLSNNSEHMDTIKVDKMLFKGECEDNCFDIVDFCTKWHDYYHNAGRYHGYSDVEHKINNEKTIISTEIISDGTGECKSLYDVLLMEDRVNNISLTAKGGYGKTFILLKLADKIVSERKDILPFFVPLSELNSSTPNCIFDFIASKASNLCCEGCSQKNLEDGLDSFSGTILFLFDGLNEITNYESRKNVLKSIINLLKWTQMRNNNIKMVVTSRYDFSSVFSDINESSYNNKFMHYQVNELSDSMIKNYLEETKCGISFETLPNEIKQLLRTPQGLHMYVCLTKSSPDRVEFRNLTELIGKYIEKTFDVSTKSKYDNALCKIGYIMVKNGSFRLHNDEYGDILDDEKIDIDLFNREIKDENLIASANTFEIEFSHQNYRDYFCAKYIANIISRIRKEALDDGIAFLSAQDDTMNNEILGFVADLLGEYRFIKGINSSDSKVQNALSSISSISIDEQKSSANIQSAVNRLISIAKLGRNNNISGLVLNNLYLVNVSLNGCTLYQKQTGKKGVPTIQTTKFVNSVVGEDTFVYRGIVGIISTVTILIDDILLIVTSHNVYLYNTSTNTCKCIYSSKEQILLRIFGSFNVNHDKYFYVTSKDSLIVYRVSINRGEVTFDRISALQLSEKNVICCYDNGSIFLINDDGFIEKLSLNGKNEIERFLIVKSDGLANKYCVSRKYIYAAKENKIYRAKLISDNTDRAVFDLFAEIETDNIDMCFVNYANSLFVCEEIGMMSRITQISEISKQRIASVEKEHTLPNDGGKVFSGFRTLISDGKRLFCGINTDVVGEKYFPISDVCEIYYDADNCKLNLLFEGHDLHNATFLAGFRSDNTIVAYSRTNSILLLNVDDETYNSKIFIPELRGVGKIVAQANNIMFVGCLDGCLQKWQKIDTEWKCIDGWKLFSNDDPVSGYEPLEFNWKISTVGNNVYACFLGRKIVGLYNVGGPDESIHISEEIADRILDIAATNYSGNVLIHALAWNKHSYEYILMDERFVVVQRTQYESSNIPLLSLLENEIVLSTDYFYEKNHKSKMLSIHNKESKEILNIQGKISNLDASCINNRKIIAFTNDENIDIHFFFQGIESKWIKQSHSPMQYNADGILEDFIANFSGTVKILWKSIVLTTKGNIIRLCAVKLNDIYYMEGCLIDNEIRILWEDHYPVKYMIYCTELLDDCIVVGDEEGVVHFIYIGDKALYTTDNIISTEIGVLSNHHVDLSTAVFENGENSLSRLNGYFILPD